jgi:lipoprotein-anchoring transpeptidase ErfK/SrfK
MLSPTDTSRRRGAGVLASLLTLAALALVVGGCGNDDAPADAARAERVRQEQQPAPPPWASRIATTVDEQPMVWRLPNANARHHRLATRMFHRGTPTFLVTRTVGDWVQVQLPTEPNGSTGWMPKDRVRERQIAFAVSIDRARRRLVASYRGTPFLTTPVAVGAAATPTPRGRFYVTHRITLTDPANYYGPYAFGLSAHSEVLESFHGKEPQIAMHGTDHPELMGQAVSNGCIRMPNRVVRVLYDRLPEGTPVTIT